MEYLGLSNLAGLDAPRWMVPICLLRMAGVRPARVTSLCPVYYPFPALWFLSVCSFGVGAIQVWAGDQDLKRPQWF